MSAAVTALDAWPATPQIQNGTGIASLSTTFAIGGVAGTRLLLVSVNPGFGGNPAGQSVTVTYGGVALTQIQVSDVTQRRFTWLGYLQEPGISARANNTITVTLANNTNLQGTNVYIASYNGVDQTTPITASGNVFINNVNAVVTLAAALGVNVGGYGVFCVHANVATNPADTWGNAYAFTNGVQSDTSANYSRVGDHAFAAAGTTNVSLNYGTVRAGMVGATLNPVVAPTTTLGNGVAGTSGPVCPGAANQKVDGFSFVNNSGTNPVTALTVTTTGTAAIASMQIWDETGPTQYFATVTVPTGNTWSFSGGTSIPVGTTRANFKILVTYDPYATAPAGNTATTALVTAFTTVNATAGTDTADTTLTLDHTPAVAANWGGNTAGNAQVILNWTLGTAGDSVMIVRYTALGDTTFPTDGTIGVVGAGFGVGGTIVYVGTGTTTTDTGLTNGTTYYYRIFEYDACQNYSATAPWTAALTPKVTTVGDGTNPGNVTICPGASATMLDAFTLQTSAGTDTVTAVTVSLAAGTFAGLSLVEITNDAGTTVYGSVANPASAIVAIALTTNITATTTLTQYKVRVTPKTAVNMPVPPGASYAVTGTVTAITDTNADVYNDTSSATVTVDNLSPGTPTAFTGVAGAAQVALSWTNPVDVDFSQVIILRRAGAAVADTPVEGVTYTAGTIIGASTVIYAGAGTSFTDTGLTNGTAYYYRMFAKDACGNYSTGAAAGPYTPAPSCDLAITKTASSGSINVNQNVTFTITVTNGGPSNATNVTVTDSLPTELTYVSAVTTLGSCSFTTPTVTCPIGAVANAGIATITLVATGNTPGTPTNTASVTATQADPNSANNSSSVWVRIQPLVADVAIVKTANFGSVAIGGNLTYTLTVTNNGPATASAVSVTDTIPAGMSWVSSSPSQGIGCSGTLTVTCNLGAINNLATATVSIVVTNNSPGTKSNTANVVDTSTNDFDPDTTNNSSTVTTTVTGAAALLCATPGQQGAGGALSGVVNTYYPGTANVAAGANCILVGTATGAATAIANGNLLLVIQMQDADIDSSNTGAYGSGAGIGGAGAITVNAGKYEYVAALGAVGVGTCGPGYVKISGTGAGGGLFYNYTNADATATKGEMRFQVIRVPQYTTATLSGATALPWSTATTGTNQYGTGGILAIDVQGDVILSSGVAATVDGLGFRGGAGRQLTGGAGANTDWRTLSTIPTNGSKGEGIGGTPEWLQAVAGPFQTNQSNDGYPNGSMGRGAPANAGGGSTDGNPAANDQNSGGGGGSNGGAGGTGGFTWSTCINNGGRGAAVTPAITKLVLGGGGGGGTRNNNPGDPQASGGAAGGGLLVIRAAQFTVNANATLNASGADSYNGTLQDGGGGGGAGGSVILTVTTGTMSGLTVHAHGGNGGSDWLLTGNGGPGCDGVNINHHGPGGGGGGGVIVYTNTALPPTLDVAGGANGVSTTDLNAFGAQPGGVGQLLYPGPGSIPGGSGAECTPDPAIALTHTGTTVAPGGTVTVIATVSNAGPFIATSGLITVVITLSSGPPALTATAWSGTGWACTITNPTVTCTRSDALAAQQSYPPISITATVGGTGPATLTNTATVSNAGDVNTANNTATDDLIGVSAPTLIRMRTFKATRVGGGVELSWRTSYEVDNLGFVLYRETGGVRDLVTPVTIAGSALFVGPKMPLTSGRSYRWLDPNPGVAAGVQYWLVDVDLNGKKTWTGPALPVAGASGLLAASEPGNSPTLDQIGHALPAQEPETPGLGAERRVQPVASLAITASAWAGAGQPAAKLGVTQEGWYRFTKADVVAAGFDPGSDPQRLQLFAEGVEQAILVHDGGDGRFDASDWVEFYGQGLDTPFTGTRVYWLIAGSVPGKRIATAPVTGQASAPVSFPFTVERKDRTLFFAALTTKGGLDNFFGAVVTSTPDTEKLAVSHLDSAADVTWALVVSLQGVTTDVPHTVDVQLNGNHAGTVSFQGQQRQTTTLTVPLAWIQEGTNAVTLTALGGADDVSVLSYVRLTYPHLYQLDQGLLRFTAPGGSRVTLGGLADIASVIRVMDVTDPANVQELPVTMAAPRSGITGTFGVPGRGTETLLAFSSATVRAPAGIEVNTPSTWASGYNRGDLLVIAHSSMVASVAPLVALRRSQGYTPVVVDVTDVYDEFNFGEKSSDAVKDFISYARTSWRQKPKYVLLVGDASFDPRNYLAMGDFDLVPTRLLPMTYLVSDCDDWFVDANNDGFPDIPIGRISVRTAAEAATVTAKIVGRDQPGAGAGVWSHNVLLVSDAKDEFDFAAASQALMPLVSSGYAVQQVKVDTAGAAAAHAAIVSGVNAGQILVNYCGHGSEDVWSKSVIFENADVPYLVNGGRFPIFVMMTCLNGLFDDLYMQCLAEELLKAPNGGAVAVWTSSALTDPGTQALMNQELFRQLFANSMITIGDAMVRAKAIIADPDVRRSWILFGDPTMKLQPAP